MQALLAGLTSSVDDRVDGTSAAARHEPAYRERIETLPAQATSMVTARLNWQI
jgi:hypothetical protein